VKANPGSGGMDGQSLEASKRSWSSGCSNRFSDRTSSKGSVRISPFLVVFVGPVPTAYFRPREHTTRLIFVFTSAATTGYR
jgi:hypothetical protein